MRTDDRFDRYTIVSYGPDQISATASALYESDDITYSFGIVATETAFGIYMGR